MFTKQTIHDIDISGKTVLIREDLNVPLNADGTVADDYRIRQALPTIEHARGMGAKVVIIAHLGRPEGKPDPNLSLLPLASKLSYLLHLPVKFAGDCVGKAAAGVVHGLQPGEVALLENLRFHPGEENNDEKFAKELAALGDIFVQDGFGVCYRRHASTEAITHFLPSVGGLLLQKEVNIITGPLQEPQRPLAVVIGGAKIAEKIGLIDKFVNTADFVAVTGAIANTFLKAQGVNVGVSLVDDSYLDTARELLDKAMAKMQSERFSFYLPHDVVVANEATNHSATRVVDIAQHTWADITSYPKRPATNSYGVEAHEQILDIGPMTAATISGALKLCHSAIYNGLAGVTEVKGLHDAADPFAHGSEIIIEALVGEHAGEQDRPTAIVVGADTVAYIESQPNIREQLGFLTTGGGASFELLAGHPMPGIDSLLDKNNENNGN